MISNTEAPLLPCMLKGDPTGVSISAESLQCFMGSLPPAKLITHYPLRADNKQNNSGKTTSLSVTRHHTHGHITTKRVIDRPVHHVPFTLCQSRYFISFKHFFGPFSDSAVKNDRKEQREREGKTCGSHP